MFLIFMSSPSNLDCSALFMRTFCFTTRRILRRTFLICRWRLLSAVESLRTLAERASFFALALATLARSAALLVALAGSAAPLFELPLPDVGPN